MISRVTNGSSRTATHQPVTPRLPLWRIAGQTNVYDKLTLAALVTRISTAVRSRKFAVPESTATGMANIVRQV
jgi:hypothetical protein